jgi:hypothetical protein
LTRFGVGLDRGWVARPLLRWSCGIRDLEGLLGWSLILKELAVMYLRMCQIGTAVSGQPLGKAGTDSKAALVTGVAVERVSILLGHQGVRIAGRSVTPRRLPRDRSN